MNQLSSYLKGVEKALASLICAHPSSEYLKKVLDSFSPDWCRFSGEGYISATELPLVLKKKLSKKTYLFCGRQVTGLENFSVKDFAVVGNDTVIEEQVIIENSVVAEKVSLKNNLSHQLILD